MEDDGDSAAAVLEQGRGLRNRCRRPAFDPREAVEERTHEHLDLEGIAPSVGTVGDAYDNALMETVNGLFKTECIRTTIFHAGPYKTLSDVEFATAGWVEWYNNTRLHSSIGMVPPTEYEHNHYAALTLEPQSI